MPFIFPLEDQQSVSSFVKFTPCNLKGGPRAPLPTVQLYLPPSIQFSDGANYEGFDLGAAGAAGMDILAAGKNDGQSASAATMSIADGIGKAGYSNLTDGVLAAVSKTPLLPTEVIQGGLQIAPNPNTRVLFKSVALRTFQFAFKMIPTTRAEADCIRDIVKFFRTQMYPTTIAGTSVGTEGANEISIAYNYPDLFLIEMFHVARGNGIGQGVGKKVPPNVKPSYLTSVSTNLNPSSGAILAENGQSEYWSEVDMSLTFGESVTLSRNDIRDGY